MRIVAGILLCLGMSGSAWAAFPYGGASVPAGADRISVRAVDEQGNEGRPETLRLR